MECSWLIGEVLICGFAMSTMGSSVTGLLRITSSSLMVHRSQLMLSGSATNRELDTFSNSEHHIASCFSSSFVLSLRVQKLLVRY